MEKVKNLINLIELATDKAVMYLKKIGKLVNNKKTHDTVYIFTQIIITMLVISILRVPFQIISELGTFIIYAVGSTFRGVFSFSWEIILELSYLLFSLFLLLKIFRNILKNKELNFIEDNRRKDTRIKKKVFNPIMNIVIVCLELLTVPFIFAILGILTLLGMDFALIVNGYIMIGLTFILIGSFLMLSSVVFAINYVTRGRE